MQKASKKSPIVGHSKQQKAILKALSGQTYSNAMATLNYCISHISSSAVFTLPQQGKTSSKSYSKGKV